jgi:hypothetical protein
VVSFKSQKIYNFSPEKAARPLNRCEYIFDVITELTKLNNEFYLIFKRILWYFPLKLELESYIDMMFNQILPDYVEGLVVQTSQSDQSDIYVNICYFYFVLLSRYFILKNLTTL